VTKDIKLYDYSLMGVKRFSSSHSPLRTLVCGHKISCLSWSPYIKSQIACSDYDGLIDVWDATLARKTHTFNEHKQRAWSVDICHPNPTLLASGSDDSTVKIWSLTQNKSVFTLEQKGNVCCTKFAPTQGHLLAVGSAGKKKTSNNVC
jgi:E3 ubiquitin-protein ligase RFWD2